MRKTNRNIKRLKFFRQLAIFLLIQLTIIALFAYIDHINSDYVNEAELIDAIVVVDEVNYEYVFASGRVFSFRADNIEYHFPKYPIIQTNEYSMKELHDAVAIGDELMIRYIEKPTGNIVVEARLNNHILRSVQPYKDFINNQRTNTIVVFAIVEMFFLTVLLFFVRFYWDEIKPSPKKVKKRIQIRN